MYTLYGNDENDPLSFQLTELSPCIDSGTIEIEDLDLPPWDLLHNERIWDGDQDGSTIIDMGCYEFGAPFVDASEECVEIPQTLKVINYPNPFNPSTTIQFNLSEDSDTILKIYNIKGQLVRNLLTGRFATGIHEVIWDGLDDIGATVSSGIYICILQINGERTTNKMLLLK